MNTAVVALPATPTVITIGNALLGTNTTTIATAPITAWPTLSIFGTTYTPSVSSGTPFWSLGVFQDATIAPGSTVTVYDRPDVTAPPDCYVFDGPCEDYFYNEGSSGSGQECGSSDQCVIDARRVQLIHFPITSTVSRNYCDTIEQNTQGVACPGGVRISGDLMTDCSYPPPTTAEPDSGKCPRRIALIFAMANF
jgi:hypothetical protein